MKDFANTIEKYLEDYSKGKAIRSTLAADVITRLKNTDTVALIVARTIFNSLYINRSSQALYREIGQALEDEWKMQEFKSENLAYYSKIKTDLQAREAKADRIRTVVNFSFAKQLDFHLEKWKLTEKIQTGLVLVKLFIETTGLVEYQDYYQKGKHLKSIVPTKKLLEYIEDLNNKFEVMNPQFLPMVCEPKKWNGLFSGGYISPYLKRNKLIKNNSKDYLETIKNLEMPIVYNAINHLQKTSWQINQKVFYVVKKLWEEGNAIAELPNRDDETLPPYPYPDKSSEDGFSAEELEKIRLWKRETYQIHKRNVQKRSIRILVAQILRIAEEFSKYEKIYFPYQMDFRGRLYPIPVLLQPQGSDLAKGMLQFAIGKGVKDSKGSIRWFKIHGANTFGFDKGSYQEREAWVDSNAKDIISFADNPLTNRGWAEADKPFQFLAWCFEYKLFIESPEEFESKIPIQLDGTCNGLQHYSALLRDNVGGKSVNLINSDKPSDIYAIVAEKLKIKLQNLPNEKLAQKWLELGFDRKLTKRPVMVLPYGGSVYSCREYIEEFLKDNYSFEYLWKFFNVGKTPNDCVFKVSQWLSKYLWQAIEDTLKCAIEGMDYIKKVSAKVSANGSYLQWKTPVGLIIRQKYSSQKKKMIRTELYGSILKSTVNIDKDELDKRKQANGICPNFIHSLDAACLMLYLNKCKQAGINHIMAVHDCYATHAADTELSAKFLREAFVEIYRQPILENFISDIKQLLPDEGLDIPCPPNKGELDIEKILDSTYFFN